MACNAGDPGSIPGLGRSAGEEIGYPLQYSWASLMAQLVKKILLQCGRPGFDPWVGKISWRRKRLPTPIFWPGEFHGLHSPWGRKESDPTEQLSLTHWVDSVRVELNCRTPSWDQRIAWGCGTAPLPPTPMLYLGAEP